MGNPELKLGLLGILLVSAILAAPTTPDAVEPEDIAEEKDDLFVQYDCPAGCRETDEHKNERETEEGKKRDAEAKRQAAALKAANPYHAYGVHNTKSKFGKRRFGPPSFVTRKHEAAPVPETELPSGITEERIDEALREGEIAREARRQAAKDKRSREKAEQREQQEREQREQQEREARFPANLRMVCEKKEGCEPDPDFDWSTNQARKNQIGEEGDALAAKADRDRCCTIAKGNMHKHLNRHESGCCQKYGLIGMGHDQRTGEDFRLQCTGEDLSHVVCGGQFRWAGANGANEHDVILSNGKLHH